MRCVSCAANIPPEWVYSIQSNICPGCGGQIMTEEAQELMHELSAAFSRMPNDPQGLAGWLMSNYRFKKIGTGEPTEVFHRPHGQGSVQNDPDTRSVKIAKSPYEEMLERTQMANQIKNTNANVQSRNSRLQEMAANIYGSDDPYGITSPGVEEASPEADREDYETLEELMSQGIDPFKGEAIQKKAGALSPQQIASMQQHGAQGSPDYVQADVDGVSRANVGRNDDDYMTNDERILLAKAGAKGQQFVQNNRFRRIKAQDALETGGGSFRRSS